MSVFIEEVRRGTYKDPPGASLPFQGGIRDQLASFASVSDMGTRKGAINPILKNRSSRISFVAITIMGTLFDTSAPAVEMRGRGTYFQSHMRVGRIVSVA